MRYISNEEIASLSVNGRQMLEWVDLTLRHKNECVLPPKISIKLPDNVFYNTMPSVIPSANVAGLKCVNRYPGNTPSLSSYILLYNLSNGQLKCLMDGDYITTWRTASVAIHSMQLFARQDYNVISFIGMGEVGKATLRLLLELNTKDIIIKIYNYKNCAQNIISQFAGYGKVTWESVDTYEDLINDSDVIFSAVTHADGDFVDEKKYKKGCVVIPIHTLGFQQCDLTFDKIFGDDRGHIQGFKYFNQFKSFNEVSDVLLGKCKGRETDDERILVYNIGISIHDLTFANYFYNLLN